MTAPIVQAVAEALIDHTRLSSDGKCLCGHQVPLGHSFAEHQAEHAVAAARPLIAAELLRSRADELLDALATAGVLKVEITSVWWVPVVHPPGPVEQQPTYQTRLVSPWRVIQPPAAPPRPTSPPASNHPHPEVPTDAHHDTHGSAARPGRPSPEQPTP